MDAGIREFSAVDLDGNRLLIGEDTISKPG